LRAMVASDVFSFSFSVFHVVRLCIHDLVSVIFAACIGGFSPHF